MRLLRKVAPRSREGRIKVMVGDQRGRARFVMREFVNSPLATLPYLFNPSEERVIILLGQLPTLLHAILSMF
jgi:hypothetical protein